MRRVKPNDKTPLQPKYSKFFVSHEHHPRLRDTGTNTHKMSETDVNESFKKDDPSHRQESSSDSKPTNSESVAKSSFFNNLKNFGEVMAETASKM